MVEPVDPSFVFTAVDDISGCLPDGGDNQNLCALTWNMSHATYFNFFPD